MLLYNKALREDAPLESILHWILFVLQFILQAPRKVSSLTPYLQWSPDA